MSRSIVVAVLAFLVLAGFVGGAVDRWVLAVWHWPWVGSEWRAERRAERLLSVPADTIEDFPGLDSSRWADAPPERRETQAGEADCHWPDCRDSGACEYHGHQCGEPLSADEWEQLGPDEAADVLIAELRGPEWHAPEAESVVDTGTLGLFSDLRLLAWDAGRQVDKIQNIRDEWRTETVAPLLAWYQVQLDARRAA